jgi:hypothetical protein
VWLRFKKKLTVIGNIAYRHGCKTEIAPQLSPSKNVDNRDFSGPFFSGSASIPEKIKMHIHAVNMSFNLFNAPS